MHKDGTLRSDLSDHLNARKTLAKHLFKRDYTRQLDALLCRLAALDESTDNWNRVRIRTAIGSQPILKHGAP